MKKLISILLSMTMLVSTGAFGITAYAKGESPSKAYNYTLGTAVTNTFNEDNSMLYYTFVPSKTMYYSFEILDVYYSEEDDHYRSYIEIDEADGSVVGDAGTNEYTGECVCSVKLKAGKRYYIEIDNFIDEYDSFTSTFTSYPHTHHYEQVAFCKAYFFSDGEIDYRCSGCDHEKTKIIPAHKNQKLSKKNYVYDGKVKTPTLTVYSRDGKKINKDYYTVKYPKGRKNVGRYKVTFKFKKYYDNEADYQYEYFYILPKSTSIKRVSAAKKGFTVKYKKQATQTTGYQIQYATDKKFKKNVKTVTVKKNSTTSAKVKGLKSKKKYYVKVRTYKTVSGKKYHSSWSGTKSVKTK